VYVASRPRRELKGSGSSVTRVVRGARQRLASVHRHRLDLVLERVGGADESSGSEEQAPDRPAVTAALAARLDVGLRRAGGIPAAAAPFVRPKMD
jgi:hypothetical protein